MNSNYYWSEIVCGVKINFASNIRGLGNVLKNLFKCSYLKKQIGVQNIVIKKINKNFVNKKGEFNHAFGNALLFKTSKNYNKLEIIITDTKLKLNQIAYLVLRLWPLGIGTKNFLSIHSSGFTYTKGSVLMLGNQGMGKSTTVTRAYSLGYLPFADDSVLLSKLDNKFIPFSFDSNLCLKNTVFETFSKEQIINSKMNLDIIHQRKVAYSLSFPKKNKPKEVTHVILISQNGSSSYSIIPPLKAATLIMRNIRIQYTDSIEAKNRSFKLVTNLINNVKCIRWSVPIKPSTFKKELKKIIAL